MINREREIFSRIYSSLSSLYPSLEISGETVLSPPSFPFCYIEEINNLNYDIGDTFTSIENAVYVTYEISVYSKLKSGKKSEAKSIVSSCDEIMKSLFFRRKSCIPLIFEREGYVRYVCRYEGKLTPDSTI